MEVQYGQMKMIAGKPRGGPEFSLRKRTARDRKAA
jgi:hypothetical protein